MRPLPVGGVVWASDRHPPFIRQFLTRTGSSTPQPSNDASVIIRPYDFENFALVVKRDRAEPLVVMLRDALEFAKVAEGKKAAPSVIPEATLLPEEGATAIERERSRIPALPDR